jgi:ABC-2 type transport system ATP-binding protein
VSPASLPSGGFIVQAENLTRTFGPFVAVDHVNLQVHRGEIFALVGPDGAGKTTTMRMLCGLMDPTEGRAVVAGRDVSRDPDAVKDQIGYMAQRFGLYSDLTVAENMAFYADLFGILGQERAELSRRLLRMTRMEPFQKRLAGNLSGGMKQKLALMCTLLHKPTMLFLDEPTNGVDPVSRRDFWVILYELVKDGLTVFVTTAYLDEAERANRVALMHQGKIICCDTPHALREGFESACYRITAPGPDYDAHQARLLLERQPGVVAMQPSGSEMHLFLDESATSIETLAAVTPFAFERAAPTLEDVFVALVRKQEAARAA